MIFKLYLIDKCFVDKLSMYLEISLIYESPI